RRNFWVLSGVVGLVFICIASLAVSISALNDPLISNNPSFAAEAQPTRTPLPRAVTSSLLRRYRA
ncbi:MAG: hypothetical protein HC915_20235, partial [Anaerolineae bacterium]|nr:hypothetical protein [Anaerolineae bacterium]